MTPKSKKELHDILLALQDGDLGLNEALWKIVAWHQQQLEQAVREARIDELNRTMPHTDGMRHYNTVKNRIAELQSTKEEESNE